MACVASLNRAAPVLGRAALGPRGSAGTRQGLSVSLIHNHAAAGQLSQTSRYGFERGHGYLHRAMLSCFDGPLEQAFALSSIARVKRESARASIRVGGPKSSVAQRPPNFYIGSRTFSTASSRSMKNSFFIRNHVGFVSVPHQMAYVVERFGRFHRVLSSGLHLLVPLVDRVAYAHSLKEEALPIPNQTAITRDNVRQKINGNLTHFCATAFDMLPNLPFFVYSTHQSNYPYRWELFCRAIWGL